MVTWNSWHVEHCKELHAAPPLPLLAVAFACLLATALCSSLNSNSTLSLSTTLQPSWTQLIAFSSAPMILLSAWKRQLDLYFLVVCLTVKRDSFSPARHTDMHVAPKELSSYGAVGKRVSSLLSLSCFMCDQRVPAYLTELWRMKE